MTVNRRSTLFLMEFIIMIAVFAVASGMCLRVFAESKARSVRAEILDHAVLEVQDAAENYKAVYGIRDDFLSLTGAESNGDDLYIQHGEDRVYIHFIDESTVKMDYLCNGESIFGITVSAVRE